MRSESDPGIVIRRMEAGDRAAVAGIISRTGNFDEAEIACALELVDIYLSDPRIRDFYDVGDDRFVFVQRLNQQGVDQ